MSEFDRSHGPLSSFKFTDLLLMGRQAQPNDVTYLLSQELEKEIIVFILQRRLLMEVETLRYKQFFGRN